MSVYVVDSNFFIQAHRANYPLDVASSFWKKVKELADDGKIISIDKVKDEIYHNDDALKHWCVDNLPVTFFKETSGVISDYAVIAAWAASKSDHYLQKAIDEFLDANEADAWLVSYTHSDKINRIVVTNELSQPARQNKVKIPEACSANGVQFVNTIEMFRQLGETF
jgi:hypothetical protein